MSLKDQLTIRAAIDTDLPFFYSSFFQSHYYSSHVNRHVSKEIYFQQHKRLIDRLFHVKRSTLLVACLQDDPDVLFGYVFYAGFVLHYIYVKLAFRKFGVAKELLYASGVKACGHFHATHWTKDLDHVLGADPGKRDWFTYDPYLLME